MPANCSTCQFWASDNIQRKDATWSRCRVNPPETSSRCIDGRFDVWVAQWPWTRSEDWCGGYKSHGMAVSAAVGTPIIIEPVKAARVASAVPPPPTDPT